MAEAETPSRDRIGPYRIVARVGAGGMGVVYKGWDPRLERDVAIKILHPDAAGDAARQKHLLSEGRAASALCHPNILRVYDADVDGETYYLVSEWLEGKSLRDELSRGPLPLKRVLDLGAQIADGLAAAHAMGVVHRDIKPENIMLARDGTARIVDFGLARHQPIAVSGDSITQSATVSLDDGVSGTPPYMSPEQARGQAGDFRTDQFSFGAMLHEMAIGARLFRRDTTAETLAAVLNDEPPSIVEINSKLPVALWWVIEQCLAKDPAERYAATEDLARELRRVRDRLREAFASMVPETAAKTRARWGMTAAIAGAAAVAAAVVMLILAPSGEPPSLRYVPIASAGSYEGNPAWSPDGQSLAWVADVDGVLQIFSRRLTDAVPVQLTRGRFDAEQPFWAPDGGGLYFVSRAGEGTALWNVKSTGGRAELVLENVTDAAIDPSGTHLAMLRMEDESTLFLRLWWSSPNGEHLVRETRAPIGDRALGLGGQLRFRPDGQQLLLWAFTATQHEGQPVSAYYLIPVDSQRPVKEVLTSIVGQANLQPVSWLPDNRHVVVGLADAFGSNQHLWIADTESPRMTRVTSTHTNETWPSVSPDGRRIAYAAEEVDFDLVSLSEDGKTQRRVLATTRNEMDPAWSPSADQYAFVTDRTGSMEIWVRSRDGLWERPLVTAADFGTTRTDTLGALAFSPDGRTIAYQRRGPDQAAIWLTPATGGSPVRLAGSDDRISYQDAPSWSPDGEWVSFISTNGAQFSLNKIRIGDKQPVRLLDRVVPFTRSAWSPDGKWIVCETFEGLVRVRADGGAPDPIIDSSALLAYTWASDSRTLFALTESESIGHLALVQIDAVTHETKTLNTDLGTIPVAHQPIRGFSYVKGHGLLTSLASARSDIWLLEGFQPPRTGLGRLFRR